MAKHAEGKEEILLSQAPHGCDEKDLIRWRNSMHRDFTINRYDLFFHSFVYVFSWEMIFVINVVEVGL